MPLQEHVRFEPKGQEIRGMGRLHSRRALGHRVYRGEEGGPGRRVHEGRQPKRLPGGSATPFAVGQKVRVINLVSQNAGEAYLTGGSPGPGRMGAGNRASRTDGGLLGAGFPARMPVVAAPRESPRACGFALVSSPPAESPADRDLEFPHDFGNSTRTALFSLAKERVANVELA